MAPQLRLLLNRSEAPQVHHRGFEHPSGAHALHRDAIDQLEPDTQDVVSLEERVQCPAECVLIQRPLDTVRPGGVVEGIVGLELV